MRKFHIIGLVTFVVLASVCGVIAGDRTLKSQILTVTPSGTNVTTSVTNATIQGFLEEIVIDMPAATVTSTVSVVYDYGLTTLSDLTLATTNGINADVTMRPRVLPTDNGGDTLGAVPVKYALTGGKVIFKVTETTLSGSNNAHKVLIKYSTN